MFTLDHGLTPAIHSSKELAGNTGCSPGRRTKKKKKEKKAQARIKFSQCDAYIIALGRNGVLAR